MITNKKVMLQQKSKGSLSYRVLQLVNCVEPQVGSVLTTVQVERLLAPRAASSHPPTACSEGRSCVFALMQHHSHGLFE